MTVTDMTSAATEPGSSLVSIVVRTRNRPKLVREALRSIRDQTYRPLETILVNDGGPPPTASDVAELLGDVTFRIVNLATSQGRAVAGNEGLAAAAGHYLGFLDDDDVLLPDHVALLVSCIQGLDYRACYSDAEICNRTFDEAAGTFAIRDCRLFTSQDYRFADLLVENFIPLMCILFEREALAAVGGFDTSFDLYEDWDLLIRFASLHHLYHVPRITARYVQWSRELQVAQTEYTRQIKQQSYDKVINKHRHWITPDVVAYLKEFRRLAADRSAVIEQTQGELTQVRGELARFRAQAQEEKQALEALQARAVAQREELRQVLSAEIAALQGQVHRLEEAAQALSQELKQEQRSARMAEEAARARIQVLEAELQAIRTSRAWRYVQRYGRLKNAILPGSPRAARALRKVRRGVEVVRSEGIAGLERRLHKRAPFETPLKRSAYPYVRLEDVETALDRVGAELDTSVSIVIPTKNAGPDFRHTLAKIGQQWGVAEVETIVVDSGSRDATVETARRSGARVIEIAPEDFHHAQTRNWAAEQARGDILVFLVQDAIPAGRDWLYQLVSPILHGEADAVSVRQLPRADADLFAQWATWGYLGYLGFTGDRVRSAQGTPNWAQRDRVDVRRFVHLDNACMGIRHDLFRDFRFRERFAEDLGLGKRLIEAGHSLMFQVSNAVIHSHTRSPAYFFRREYVDQLALVEILGWPRGTCDTSRAMATAAWAYEAFCATVQAWVDDLAESGTVPRDSVHQLIGDIRRAFAHSGEAPTKGLYDQGLWEILEPFRHGGPDRDLLRELEDTLCGNLHTLGEHVLHYRQWAFPPMEIAETMHKFFGFSAGIAITLAGADISPELVRGI